MFMVGGLSGLGHCGLNIKMTKGVQFGGADIAFDLQGDIGGDIIGKLEFGDEVSGDFLARYRVEAPDLKAVLKLLLQILHLLVGAGNEDAVGREFIEVAILSTCL
jgi:hypothetical protein